MKKEHEKYEHESKAFEIKEHKGKHHSGKMPHIGNRSVEHMLEVNNKLITTAMGKTKKKLM